MDWDDKGSTPAPCLHGRHRVLIMMCSPFLLNTTSLTAYYVITGNLATSDGHVYSAELNKILFHNHLSEHEPADLQSARENCRQTQLVNFGWFVFPGREHWSTLGSLCRQRWCCWVFPECWLWARICQWARGSPLVSSIILLLIIHN